MKPEYALIISSSIAVIGWFVNSLLNRIHEISKKRMDYRLESLKSFLPAFVSLSSSPQPFIDDPTLSKKIVDARVNFQLYGYQDEIVLFNEFVSAIENKDTTKVTSTINELISLVRVRLRKELNLPNATL